MKRRRIPKVKFTSLHIYGILDKRRREITRVSLDKEEIQFEIDLDNHEKNFGFCDFTLKIKIPIELEDY